MKEPRAQQKFSGFKRVLEAKNYIFGNYDRSLRGPKENFGSSEEVLVAIKICLGDLTEPCKLPKSKSLKGSGGGGHVVILRSKCPDTETIFGESGRAPATRDILSDEKALG